MGGIRSEPLNTLAKQIWHWCMSREIWLSAQYVPGDLNAEADSASRLFSEDLEWSLHPTIFSELQSTIWSPDIDLFASRLNFKVEKYVSWHPDPGAYAVDAFSLSWCRERNVDSLQAHVSQVLNFLADYFGEGLSSSTLNSYRSALSSTLCPRDGTTVGCDPLVSRLLKGIYNLRPPLPRYSSTWDVSVLTQYLGTLFPLNSLSLKQLTLKTVSLCALCSAGRSQTLGALSISNLVQHKESIQFIVTERLKTSRPGKPSVIVIFPSVPSKPHVCPMSTVSAYITRNCNLRNPTDFRLFISFVKPHRAVSPATISRWIKTVLSDAGIDISIFKAHSVRGAATSAAYNKGVPVENILKLANWSNESTSRRFYLRSAEPEITQTRLKNKKSFISLKHAVGSYQERVQFVKDSSHACMVVLSLLIVFTVVSLAVNVYVFLFIHRSSYLYIIHALLPLTLAAYPLHTASWVTKQYHWHLVAVVQAWINISDSESDSDSELSDPQVTNNNGHATVPLTTDQNDQRASEANLRANTPGKTTCITVKPWREDRIYKLQNVFSGSARFIGKLRHKKEFRRKFQFEKYIRYLEKVSRREGFSIGVVLITWELVSALFFFLISLITLFIQESIFGKAESTIKM
ncbi:hypothetical protein P5673_027932 [Acropora cervicornis]|uniref:Tyr recombinase domain-containing protein n=1 Tax=Acropora cervicornis TaxID=6130 RepID=A0AAD9PY11_ACRCE|nr:hypothetical protein P5673_027932 [Acropora cervicornis]